MVVERDGGCQCGAIRYRVLGEPISLSVCHCKECQRQSGSAFGMSLRVRKEQFALLCGTLKSFARPSDGGFAVVCSFCPECGTRIVHEPKRWDDIVHVRAGTLDDTSWLKPGLQVWTASKQPWLELRGDIPSVPGQPERR